MGAEAHFAMGHRHMLKDISFIASRHDDPRQAVLIGSCDAAHRFLDEMFKSTCAPGGAQMCNAVIRVIVKNWIRAFRHSPRLATLDTSSFAIGIGADEAALEQLAARFGTEAIWANLPSSEEPLQPLREVRQMLVDPSPEAS